jgi:GTP-binding protein
VRQTGRRGSGDAGTEPRRQEQQAESDRGARGAPFAHPAVSSNPLGSLPVEFVGSFPDPKVQLEPTLPEIAFVGRSNVGKSSLINALLGRPGLARVSGTPGKTTLLNFYRLPSFYLVDLPGYGFARASKSSRAGYRKLVLGYLRAREPLAGIVWLLDIRRDPSAEDREMQELLIQSERPVLAVFTKADKLTRSALGLRTQALARALNLSPEQVELTSTHTGLGIGELATSVATAAGGHS